MGKFVKVKENNTLLMGYSLIYAATLAVPSISSFYENKRLQIIVLVTGIIR
jgi:hypothetical protein